MMRKKIIVLFILSLIIFSCEDGIDSKSTGNFAIYFMKDSDLSYTDVYELNIDDLELSDNKWLSSDDIELYDFSTHYIYLNNGKTGFFSDYLDGEAIFTDFVTKPFVVIAAGERIYLGSLLSSLSSIRYAGPSIMDFSITYYPEDIIPIEYGVMENGPRSDIRIKNALINENIYHGGLELALSDIVVLENSDTSTVQYTYTLTNNDLDNLYILDPDIVGSQVFHYYTNGVVFWNDATHYIESYYKITDNSEWSTSWFSEIKSGETITRTVILRGYPEIPRLSYKCHFRYSSPVHIEKSDRTINNIRIWLGSIQSNYLVFDYKE